MLSTLHVNLEAFEHVVRGVIEESAIRRKTDCQKFRLTLVEKVRIFVFEVGHVGLGAVVDSQLEQVFACSLKTKINSNIFEYIYTSAK